MLEEASRPTRTRSLLLILGAGLIVYILWNVPQLSPILYPLRLFVTYAHEAGHGLIALLTGGHLMRFEIFADGSGVALTAGGNRALILPAGYLGAALFGGVLFFLTNTVRHSRAISVVLGVGLIIFSVLFGGLLTTAFLVGVGFGLILIWLGWKAGDGINTLLLNALAIMTGLNAVLDVWFLVGSSGASLGDVRNDAAAFSAEIAPLIPGAVWALLWVVLALIILGVAVWFSVIKPIRKR